MTLIRTPAARRAAALQVCLAAVLLSSNAAQPIAGEPAQTRVRTPPAPPIGTAVARGQSTTGDITGLTPERAEVLVDAARRGLDHVPGEVLVKFRAGTTTAGLTRALSALRAPQSAAELQWRGGIARIVDPGEPDARRLAERLARQPEVEYAEPNYIRRVPLAASTFARPERLAAVPSGVPNDPDYSDLQWNLSMLNMPAAWDISPGGKSSVVVAVVDTGVTTASTTLNRRLWVGQAFETLPLRFEVSPDITSSRFASPRDFAFEPGGPVLDFDGHGTHVASTIAEDANNLRSVAGIAYSVRIMPVKVCVGFWEVMLFRAAANVPGYAPTNSGGCSSQDIADGIRYAADNGAKVINLSLGGTFPSTIEREAIVYAVNRGAVVVNAVGNSFEEGNPPDYPASYAPAIEGLISVAAVGKSKSRAYYSGTGSHVEMAAPGGSSRDGGGEDRGFIWQVTLVPTDQDPLATPRPRFDRYAEIGYSGTSMATAHVSAAAALLVSQGVTSPRAIEAILKATAEDLGAAGRDDSFGYGLVQPRTALFGQGIRR